MAILSFTRRPPADHPVSPMQSRFALAPADAGRTSMATRLESRFGFGALVGLLLLGACDAMVEKAPARPEAIKPERPSMNVDVPQMMRGTIAAESLVLGYRDVIVRGFGLVVGLDGTGTRVMPADVRAFMIQDMGKRGVGLPPLSEFTPEELLDSLDTAVVIVEGVIPAGSPAGTTFDVRIYTAPGTQTTSLEGGRLYTCDLRPGEITTANRQASSLAEARGPVFVNPFLEPTKGKAATRLSGRVLDGGTSTRDMPVKLRLYTPSHNRAATLQSAINSAFPREPGQKDPTGRGQSGETVSINIPPSFRGDTREFIELLRHTSISLDAPELIATQVRRALLAQPNEGDHAAWRWQALGTRTLPVVQDLYNHPEDGPRVAALTAGARLNDPLVVPRLVEQATEGSRANRLTAIELLKGMGVNPAVDKALRGLLQDDDVDIRAEALLALAERFDPAVVRRPQGKKFELLTGPGKVPTIHITQSGTPRLAVASNEPISIQLPVMLTAWSNRLMIKGDVGSEEVEVFFRRDTERADRTIADAPVDLVEFIEFLAHRPTVERPRSGLDLTYSETIGVLWELVKSGNLKVDFKTEQDRLLARILQIEEEGSHLDERPEFGDPEFDYLETPGEDEAGEIAGAGTGTTDGGLLSPIDRDRSAPSVTTPSTRTSGVPGATGGIVPR